MNGIGMKGIIAVFGGSKCDKKTCEKAEKLGEILATHDYIVLTGGTGCGGDSVKEKAIDGVRKKPGLWVGVARDEKNEVGAVPKDSGLAINTHLGRRRNFLAAHMCDAAIGLSGGSGTNSEVTFSLALRRPVVLWGDDWEDLGSGDDLSRQAMLESMVDCALRYVREPSCNRALDDLLEDSVSREELAQLPPEAYMYLAPSKEPLDAVCWIKEVLERKGRHGCFPDLEREEYGNVKTMYENWLSEDRS